MKSKSIVLLLALLMIASMSFAQKKRVYLNPVQSKVSVTDNSKKRIATTVMMGLSRAKTIEAVMGDKEKNAADLSAEGYDLLVSLVVTEAQATQDTELFSDKKKDTYTASLKTDLIMTDVKTGQQVASSSFSGSASEKDKQVGFYKAANAFDEATLDFIDNSLPVEGEIIEVQSTSDEEEAKAVRINAGAALGVRKDMMFAVYKVQDDNPIEMGKARCEHNSL